MEKDFTLFKKAVFFLSLIKRIRFSLLLPFFLLPLTALGQNNTEVGPVDSSRTITVQGTVISTDTEEPIIGATVKVKDEVTGTITNANGQFSLPVRANATLEISSIGYSTIALELKGREELRISLETSTIMGKEVVISGFQVEKVSNITGSIAVIDAEKLKQITEASSSSPIKALQGHVPGFFVYTNGDPTGKSTVRIRGVNTLNNNDPLYVVDGVPVTQNAFELINPIDIESISIVKDEATAAIYGSRASNGVVVITTKRAKPNTLNVVYSAKIGFQKLVNRPKMLDAEGRARAQWQAAINDGVDPATIPNVNYDWSIRDDGSEVLHSVSFPEMITDKYQTSNTDWVDAITRTGLIQDHSILVSEGGERGGALFSFRYHKNKYIEKFQDFKKYSARINSYYYLTPDKKIEIGENIGFTSSIDNGHAESQYNKALVVRPILPIYTTDGDFSGPPTGDFSDQANPLRELYQNRWDQRKNTYLLGNAYVKIRPIKNLTVHSSFGFNWSNLDVRDIQLRFQAGYTSRDDNSLKEEQGKLWEWNYNLTGDYEWNFNNNNFTFLVGFSSVKNRESLTSAERFKFTTQDNLDYFVLDAGTGSQVVSGSGSGFTLASYFGKVDYSFEDKYLALASLRVDGSSKFAKENRYGVFPAFSAGWNLYRENFIQNSVPFISNLKLKASWAEVGNQFIAPDSRLSLYNSSYSSSILHTLPWDQTFVYANYATSYDIGGVGTGNLPSGFRRIQSGNPNLKWESTVEKNFGLEFGFLENQISGEVNYFTRKTKDILVFSPGLAALGEGANRYLNGATLQTNGWEVALQYFKTLNSSFQFGLTASLGHYEDKIIKLEESVISDFQGNVEHTILGHSMNAVFGYVADGIFKSQEEMDRHADQPGAGLGRIRYKDLNGDGKIDSKDRDFLGTTTPNYEYGLGLQVYYKQFSLNIFAQGIFGSKALDGRRLTSDFTGLYAGNNYGPNALKGWTPTNNNSNVPALSANDQNNEGRLSTYFIRNGSYLKLRQVNVGYTFDELFKDAELRIFIEAENIWTLKSHSFLGKDPENPSLGITGANDAKTAAEETALAAPFPRPAVFVFGVTFSL